MSKDEGQPAEPKASTEVTQKPGPQPDSSAMDTTDKLGPKGNIKVSQKPPTKQALAAVADILVVSNKKESVRFGSLHSQRPGRKTLVLFIRHFFCGNCQEYLRTLCSSVTPAVLATLPVPTDVVVIGCGQPELIDFYAEATSCPYPIYAEPTKEIYAALGMARTLDLGPSRPDYMQKSLAAVMLSSVWQGLSQGSKAFRGGDYWQVGGEFLLQDGAAVFAHRMRNTRDHAEVPAVRKALGLDDAAIPLRRKRWSLAHSPLGSSGSLSRSFSRSRSRAKDGSGRDGSSGKEEPRRDGSATKVERVAEEDKENVQEVAAA